MSLPEMIRIRQKFKAPILNDIPREIAFQVSRLNLEKKITRGQTVAVACSSRGITNYSTIIEATIRSLKQIGLEPFIIPAMGSHGSATAKGQEKVLKDYGIFQETMGVPVRSSLEVVQIGETEDHIPVFTDREAFKADYIVPVNRIKSHTLFNAEIESGLMKLLAVGLGNQKGPAIYHQACFNYGYPRVIFTVARKVMERKKVLFGIGIVENGYCQTAKVAVLEHGDLENKEKDLLRESKDLEASLPFEDVDILIVDEMGKDISGAGIDCNVIGRIYMPLITNDPETPRIKRIIVSDLTEKTAGNAVGVGLADFVTRRLVNKISMDAMYINAITTGDPEHVKIPLTLENDRDAIDAAVKSIGLIPPEKLKIIRIKNTKTLGEMDVSQGYREELLKRKDLEIITIEKPMVFDNNGNLAA